MSVPIGQAAPSAARRLAIAAPMPRESPVTGATLPESFLLLVDIITCGWFVIRLGAVLLGDRAQAACFFAVDVQFFVVLQPANQH